MLIEEIKIYRDAMARKRMKKGRAAMIREARRKQRKTSRRAKTKPKDEPRNMPLLNTVIKQLAIEFG
jgi:hypothetical protein